MQNKKYGRINIARSVATVDLILMITAISTRGSVIFSLCTFVTRVHAS